MSPSIEAAWIAAGSGLLGVTVGVAGTVVVALAGFRNTRRSTAATVEASSEGIRAQIEADGRTRFWEKRASAYEAALAMVRYRAETRADRFRVYRMDEETEKKALDNLEAHEPPGLFEIQGRLLAYASSEVLNAYLAAEAADREAANAYVSSRAGLMQSDALFRALEAAQEADTKLTDIIRTELHRGPDMVHASPGA